MKRFLMSLSMIFVACLLMGFPVSGQDDTPPAPVASAEATLEGTAESTPPPTPPSQTTDPVFVLSLWQILAGLAGAVAIGGIGGIAGAGVIAVRLMNNPVTMAAIEHAGNGVPPAQADKIIALANGFGSLIEQFKGSYDNLAELTRRALDRIPEAEKVVAQAAPTPGQIDVETSVSYQANNPRGPVVASDVQRGVTDALNNTAADPTWPKRPE